MNSDVAVIYTVRQEFEVKCKSASKTNKVSLCDDLSLGENNFAGFVNIFNESSIGEIKSLQF